MSDGAAATLLMSRAAAARLGMPILGTLRSFAVAGVPPQVMGVGPAFAIPEALKRAGLTIADIGAPSMLLFLVVCAPCTVQCSIWLVERRLAPF